MSEDDFDDLLVELSAEGVTSEEGYEEFTTEFIKTNRDSADVCPGVSLHYRWDRTEALDLDENDRLTDTINGRVREAVRTWGAESAWEDIVTQIDA